MDIAEFGWLPPLVSALLMLSVGIFVLIRYFQNRMLGSLYWGIALLSYGASHMMEFAFLSALVVEIDLTFFIRQTLLVLMLIFFYAGCAVALTKKKLYRALSTLFFFIIQEAVVFYFDFVKLDFTLSSAVHIIFFVIPFSVFFTAFFLVDYFSVKRKATLLIAAGWLVYAVIVPVYFLWKKTPLLPLWFVLRTLSLIPLLLGFVSLAYTKTRTRVVDEAKDSE